MVIKKIGHCCLVIESEGVRLMTDPGVWTAKQEEERDIDAILITHEHPDHMHIPSLQAVLSANPDAIVIANSGVGVHLRAAGIVYRQIVHGESADVKDVDVEGFGHEHAPLYSTVPTVANTGFLIGRSLFYPGDAFTLPERSVDILALPVVGPWMKLSEALDYAQAVKPRIAFPVHDGMLRATDWLYRHPATILPAAGIGFVNIEVGTSRTV